MREEPVFRCGPEITGAGHGEWQGVLRTDGGAMPFRSVPELLCLIRARAGPSLPGWDPERR